jgi:hypothetical protein
MPIVRTADSSRATCGSCERDRSHSSSRLSSSRIATLFVLILAASNTAGRQGDRSSVTAHAPHASRLFKDSRQTLAIARAQGRQNVTVLVVAQPGEVRTVVQRALELRGNVRYRDDDIGYVRVSLPIDRASDFAESNGVEAAAFDLDPSYPDRLIEMRQFSSTIDEANDSPGTPPKMASQSRSELGDVEPWPPTRWSDYPLRHPYSPLRDIDAEDFLVKHPSFDGRGVTIAILDGNIDFLLPEFQTAYRIDGTPVSKLADVLNVTDPRDDAEFSPQWVDMREQVVAHGRHAVFQGKSFTTPRDGGFRIGLFDERRLKDKEIDHICDPQRTGALFGVLWDEETNDVWVDTNSNGSFADEKAMTDYSRRHDVGTFGRDDPATPVRESIGFTVQTDPKGKFISLNLGTASHATLVIGAVVGNRTPTGLVQGVAPGARLVSISWSGGASLHSMLEGVIAAFKHPQVDLIVLEQHLTMVGATYLPADAHHPVSIVAQRLTERYHKLLFVPALNPPGFGLVGEDGLADAAVSVGGYQSQESYRLNAGFITQNRDNMHYGALSHGPSGTGALKPDFLAPTGHMSLNVGFRKGGSLAGLFQLPPGYRLGGGTSTAAPMAAGIAALVMSAARQTGVTVDATLLKAALASSARYIPHLAAHEQGNGLLQVEAAYNLLTRLQSAPALTITSKAPVRTRLSNLLWTPDQGVGIYEREGWTVGDEGIRTVALTRTSGPSDPVTFSLSWLGNDGTFSSPAFLVLPRNQPVELPVHIAIKEAGAHSAVLTLDTPSMPGHVYRMLNTVVVPLRFTAENKYQINAALTIPRPGDRSVFVEVPPGAAVLGVSATGEDGNVDLSLISPEREPLEATQRNMVARPEPGVWEVNVSTNESLMQFTPHRPQPVKAAKVKLNVALWGVDINVGAKAAKIWMPGEDVDVPVEVSNRFGEISASVASLSLSSAFTETRTIVQGEQHVYEIIVPNGVASLEARVSGVADVNADLDLYLLDCTGQTQSVPRPTASLATPRRKANTVDSDGRVQVSSPAPGLWKVVVDAYSVPSGQTTYSYVDLLMQPKFGSLSASDAPEKRQPGAMWRTSARAWIASLPDTPRILRATVTVNSPDVRAPGGGPLPLGTVDVVLGPSEQTPLNAGHH